MADLGNISKTIDVIKKYDFNFQKKFGQNFLIDKNILSGIINGAQIDENDMVIEIGPGIGTMTQMLCERARRIVAVEIDKNLIPILNETLSSYDNVKVINEDILNVDIRKLVEEENAGKPVKIVANLPYYITTPIVMGLLEGNAPIKSITIMIQKEVADRINSVPGGKEYGALSLAVQYRASTEVIMNVSPECFIPKPKVGSCVIRLDLYTEKPIKADDESIMFKIIRAAFNQRRKTLINGLKNAQNLNYTKEQITRAIEKMGLDENIRGEKLSLEEFVELSNILG